MFKRLLLSAIGVAALTLNPFFGCGEDVEYSYGASEMRAAVEGTWKLSLPASGSTPARDIELTISQSSKDPTEQQSRAPSFISEAAACGNRSLVKPAGACIDSSTMPLDIVLVAGRETGTGRLEVHGLTFHQGYVTLDLGSLDVTAQTTPDGTMSSVRVNNTTDATLVRLATARR